MQPQCDKWSENLLYALVEHDWKERIYLHTRDHMYMYVCILLTRPGCLRKDLVFGITFGVQHNLLFHWVSTLKAHQFLARTRSTQMFELRELVLVVLVLVWYNENLFPLLWLSRLQETYMIEEDWSGQLLLVLSSSGC